MKALGGSLFIVIAVDVVVYLIAVSLGVPKPHQIVTIANLVITAGSLLFTLGTLMRMSR